jgi:flagella basal body P-ring formation protein FlgA
MAGALALLFVSAASASPMPSAKKTVRLSFADSVMVNDTLIRIGDIAKVTSDDAALAASVRAIAVGEAAPAGFSRFVNSADLVLYRVKPQVKDAEVISENQKRVKITSDCVDKTVGDFEDAIRAYAAERLEWEDGEWSLTVANAQSAWKMGKGAVETEFSGLENPYAKGNVNFILTARQGSKSSRVPVSCRITVKAPVLVAARTITRGEELNAENSKVAVTDITNFAYAPLKELPKAGTATAIRTISAGNILHDKALKPIPLVERGDQVRVVFNGERISVSVLGVARGSGSQGDRIWVENLQTGKLIRAAVSGKGSAVVHQEGERS